MKKKLIALVLSLAALGTLAGCSAMLESEVFVVTDYEDYSDVSITDTDAVIISDYSSLKRALTSLVASHTDTATFRLSNYSGDIEHDLGEANREVKNSTALGAYSVDYFSFNISRIVSYSEVDINVNFKRTREQVDSIIYATSVGDLREAVFNAIAEGQTYLAVHISSGSVSAENIRGYLADSADENPLLVPVVPGVTVSVYPETGFSKIFELELDYGYTQDELENMREMLDSAAENLVGDSDGSPYSLFASLAAKAEYDTESGSTAYSVLVDLSADSRGFALTFKALCEAFEIPCTIVSGTKNAQPHFWTIVELDGICYHVDPSTAAETGAQVYLFTDSQLAGTYSWDSAQYPECNQEITS